MGAEELTTERLRLTRPVAAADAAGVFAVLGDLRTTGHNPSDALRDLAEAGALVDRWERHWEEHGFGYRCVREHDLDRVIGYAGVKRSVLGGRPVLNLVYRFVPEVWGRGLATEAASAAVALAREETPAETIVARVRPGNHASQGVAAKVGLQRDASLDHRGEDGLDWVFTTPPVRRRPR